MDNMNPPFVIYYCLFHGPMAAGANVSPNMGPPGNLGKNPGFEFCRFAEVHGYYSLYHALSLVMSSC